MNVNLKKNEKEVRAGKGKDENIVKANKKAKDVEKDKVFKQIVAKLSKFNKENENKGQVRSVKDGVAQIAGLKAIKVGEIIEFAAKAGQKTTYGMALNLEKKSVGCVIFGDDRQIKQNDLVIGRGRLLDIEINKNVLGRVVDALGHPIDGKGQIQSAKIRIKVERKALELLLGSQLINL